MKRTLLIIILMGLCGGGTAEENPMTEANESIIRDTLTLLLESEVEQAFVVFEHTPSGKFVQLAGSKSDPLLLDLPTQTLNGDELKRAVELFGEYGVELETWEVYDRPGGHVVGAQSGFQFIMERDLDIAVEISLRIFHEVFGLPSSFELNMIVNM